MLEKLSPPVGVCEVTRAGLPFAYCHQVVEILHYTKSVALKLTLAFSQAACDSMD